MPLRFLTAGESHGKALVGIIEGLPSNLPVTSQDIQTELQRRKLGYGRGSRQKLETDTVEILSGVRHGKTLGSPIALLIENKDWKNWSDIMQSEPFTGEVKKNVETPRPGHGDYIGGLKYNHKDMRNVLERASARETAMRVALGSVARKLLLELDIHIVSRVLQIGEIKDPTSLEELDLKNLNALTDSHPTRVTDGEADKHIMEHIDLIKREGNTLGGTFEVIACGLPLGLGSYAQWDRRLEADIGRSFLSLNAIKGVEIGLGFKLAPLKGSQVHDSFYPSNKQGIAQYKTNFSGGIDGGMSTGQPLIIRAVMKPLSTLISPLPSVNLSTGEPEKAHIERSDVCAVPSAAVIGESLLALALADKILEKFGGDDFFELKNRFQEWKEKC